MLDASCQSGPARPATKLQFFINDIPISQAYANLTETVNPIVQEDDAAVAEENEIYKSGPFDTSNGNQELNSIDYQMNSINKDINHASSLVLFNTTLRLRIRLRQSLLKAKKTFNLRCASYVTHLFTKSSEHVFKVLAAQSDEQQENAANDLSKPFNRKKNSFLKNFNKKTFGPFIDNTRSNYQIGDLINVTCFTGFTKVRN